MDLVLEMFLDLDKARMCTNALFLLTNLPTAAKKGPSGILRKTPKKQLCSNNGSFGSLDTSIYISIYMRSTYTGILDPMLGPQAVECCEETILKGLPMQKKPGDSDPTE